MSTFSYVYVLVSKPGDTYLEQTLISVVSLRRHMPDANIVLLVDNKTADSLNGTRAEIKKYVSCVKSVSLPDSLSNMQKSRWLKTTMPDHIGSDFLYIDSDTVVVQSLQEIETLDVNLGAVLDKHTLLSSHCNKKMIAENARKLGFHEAVENKHFNGGLLLVRANEKNKHFFQEWHRLWQESVKRGLSIDQAALAQTNFIMNGPIQELPGIWNCQVEYGMQFISTAKILHMFVTGDKFNRRPHILMDPSFYKSIETNGLTEETMDLIRNPLNGFKNKTQIIGGEAVDYFNSYLSRFCCLLYCSSSQTRKVFNVLNSIIKFVMTRLKA